MGHSRSLFLISYLSIQLSRVDGLLNLLMTGFKLRISGVGSHRSAQCAITIAHSNSAILKKLNVRFSKFDKKDKIVPL